MLNQTGSNKTKSATHHAVLCLTSTRNGKVLVEAAAMVVSIEKEDKMLAMRGTIVVLQHHGGSVTKGY